MLSCNEKNNHGKVENENYRVANSRYLFLAFVHGMPILAGAGSESGLSGAD